VKEFRAEHGEDTFEKFLAHYAEYTDVVGDHFLNLAATTLPTNAYLLSGEPKYRRWLVEYMDAWLDRMGRNGGVIPSFVDLDGTIGGATGKWWGNAYGWGFSPVNPVTGVREDRNRIPWALAGFGNALLVTGDQKYVDAWRNMIAAVNSHARESNGRRQYPSMYGAAGWYGWRDAPWNVGALEVWYWSQKAEDLERIAGSTSFAARGWLDFLQARSPAYPEQALDSDLKGIRERVEAFRRDTRPPEKRLADNMLGYNPGRDGVTGAVDVGRADAGPLGRPAERPAPVFRSGPEACRRAPRRRRARVRALGHFHDRDSRQSQLVAGPNRHRPGRRLPRAPAPERHPRRRDDSDRCATAHGPPRPGCGQTLVLA
jgi:hypothetical protein